MILFYGYFHIYPIMTSQALDRALVRFGIYKVFNPTVLFLFILSISNYLVDNSEREGLTSLL